MVIYIFWNLILAREPSFAWNFHCKSGPTQTWTLNMLRSFSWFSRVPTKNISVMIWVMIWSDILTNKQRNHYFVYRSILKVQNKQKVIRLEDRIHFVVLSIISNIITRCRMLYWRTISNLHLSISFSRLAFIEECNQSLDLDIKCGPFWIFRENLLDFLIFSVFSLVERKTFWFQGWNLLRNATR